MQKEVACLAIQRPLTDFPLSAPSVRASMHASESWHSGTNAPYQGSGTNAVPPEPMHQDANRFLSGRSWRLAPSPLPEDPGVQARTRARLTCGRPLPGGGAPGPSRSGRRSRCAALGRGKAARSGACPATGGEGARVSCPAQPHFHPLLPRGAGGGVSTHAQSRPAEAAAGEKKWKEGWMRKAGKLVSKRGATGRRAIRKYTAGCRAYGG